MEEISLSLSKTNNDVIAYSVDKTSNSSLYISVQNGEVIVKAPWYYTRKTNSRSGRRKEKLDFKTFERIHRKRKY